MTGHYPFRCTPPLPKVTAAIKPIKGSFPTIAPPSWTVNGRPFPHTLQPILTYPQGFQSQSFSRTLRKQQVPTQHTRKERLFLGKLPSSHSCWFSLPSPLLSSPPFLIHFSLVYLPQTLSLALLCLKRKDYKHRGESGLRGWVRTSKSFREGARKDFLQCNSYFPPNCQTPFSPSLFLRTSYLGSFPFLPPGSGVLGPESPLSKNVEIISPVKGRRTKIRFGGKSEEMAGCFDRSI